MMPETFYNWRQAPALRQHLAPQLTADASCIPHAAKREPTAAAAKQSPFPLVPPEAAAAQAAAAARAAGGSSGAAAAAAVAAAAGGDGSLAVRPPFRFDSPSPDDVVLAAQQGRPIGGCLIVG